MIKKILAGILILLIIAVMTGFYPVGLVDNSPILARSLRQTEEARKNFINAQARSSKLKPIDFSSAENKDLAFSVKKQALALLIEDKIIEQEGEKVFTDFSRLSRQRLDESMQGEKDADMDKAVRAVYNLNLKDFRELILLPQTRRDIMRIFLANEGRNFDEWLGKEKSAKKVILMFVPFVWNEAEVR